MPKMKRQSAAKKRFKVTASGKILRRRRHRTTPPGHLIKGRPGKRKRGQENTQVAPSDRRAHKKLRKVLGQAKGYWGRKSTHYRYAKEQVEHSLVYAYRDRKNRKREFRR